MNVIQEVLKNHKSFLVDFKGITASPSCVMIKGFPKDNTLNEIRDNLRKAFANSGLQQSIDTRYRIQTAHSTVVRLRKKLINKDKFLAILDKYRNYDFGSFTANTIELVYNDWYHRKDNVRSLHKFNITPL